MASRLLTGVPVVRSAEEFVGMDIDDRGTSLNVNTGLTSLAQSNYPDKWATKHQN